MPDPMHMVLDLLFERHGAKYQARVVRSPVGLGQAVRFALPVTGLELDNFALRIGKPQTPTRRQESEPVIATKQLGARLFDAVFAGPVGECLRRSMDRARSQGATLRILLRLSECPDLADLPWELLYDAKENWFYALSDATPVVRYVQAPVEPRAVPVALPLRVLTIRSEPEGEVPLDLAAEWRQVMAALHELIDTGALVVTELVTPTFSELTRALDRDTFHVLHYMGHGAFNRRDGGTLTFANDARRSSPIAAEKLGVLLHDHASLRLAIINACEAARVDPEDPFAGVADTLVRRGIPAVVAMQFEISDRAAIEFAPALYAALADGRPVDAAIAAARKAIFAVSDVEWATPVLYLRSDDAGLLDMTKPSPLTTSALPSDAVPQPDAPQVGHGADARRSRKALVRRVPSPGSDPATLPPSAEHRRAVVAWSAGLFAGAGALAGLLQHITWLFILAAAITIPVFAIALISGLPDLVGWLRELDKSGAERPASSQARRTVEDRVRSGYRVIRRDGRRKVHLSRPAAQFAEANRSFQPAGGEQRQQALLAGQQDRVQVPDAVTAGAEPESSAAQRRPPAAGRGDAHWLWAAGVQR